MSIETKYRVHELGKDFGIHSKEIMDILAIYSHEPKNHMAVLTEKELDIVFDYFTKKHQVETLEVYFTAFPAPVKQEAKYIEEIKPVAGVNTGEQKPQDQKVQDKTPQVFQKPVSTTQLEQKPLSGKVEDRVRYVDTRTANVDLSKFDERIDKLVPDKAKDIGNQMQKLKKAPSRAQKSSNKYREEEASKLKRLEIEKKKKASLKLELPEELAVSDLASRLMVTNAEVVKKLMLLGIMASASQIIDYDTAALIAEEFGAKVK
ncbi:MAG: translation initiation factor IF-2 N-terminal domain-containing protein, partial [archaeon]